jgi:hypothetical protein
MVWAIVILMTVCAFFEMTPAGDLNCQTRTVAGNWSPVAT